MPVDPEILYLQLAQLVAEMPEMGGRGMHPPETYRWLGRAAQLVAATGNTADRIGIDSASETLGADYRSGDDRRIAAIVYRALAFAEAQAPAAARGGVVAVGEGFTAVQVISKVLAEAHHDALIIDPYMDGKVFTDFAPLAPAGVLVKLLSDSFSTKAILLMPLVTRWAQQFGSTKPIEVRLSAPRALHDRLIILDGTLVYSVTQSLKDFAGRSPALVQRVDQDLAKLKVDHYNTEWAASSIVA